MIAKVVRIRNVALLVDYHIPVRFVLIVGRGTGKGRNVFVIFAGSRMTVLVLMLPWRVVTGRSLARPSFVTRVVMRSTVGSRDAMMLIRRTVRGSSLMAMHMRPRVVEVRCKGEGHRERQHVFLSFAPPATSHPHVHANAPSPSASEATA